MAKKVVRKKPQWFLRSQGRKYYEGKGSGQQALTYLKGQVR